MDAKEMSSLIEDVAYMESVEMADDLAAEGLRFDVAATTDAIYAHLVKDKDFLARLKKMNKWQAEEYVHLAALDYFGQYEPVMVPHFTHYYSYDCWKCPKRHGGQFTSESADPAIALAEISEQWNANDLDAWDYELAIHTKEELDLLISSQEKVVRNV